MLYFECNNNTEEYEECIYDFNNTEEYEECIYDLKSALEIRVRKLDVYNDSMLITCQVKGEWHTKYEKLKLYQRVSH